MWTRPANKNLPLVRMAALDVILLLCPAYNLSVSYLCSNQQLIHPIYLAPWTCAASTESYLSMTFGTIKLCSKLQLIKPIRLALWNVQRVVTGLYAAAPFHYPLVRCVLHRSLIFEHRDLCTFLFLKSQVNIVLNISIIFVKPKYVHEKYFGLFFSGYTTPLFRSDSRYVI